MILNKLKQVFLAFILLGFSVNGWSAVDINLLNSTKENLDFNTFKMRHIDVFGGGLYWASFRWNRESLVFEMVDFGQETTVDVPAIVPITPTPVDPTICTKFDEGYCDQATYPTCEVSNSKIKDIEFNMNYNDVVEEIGCHGVLDDITDDPFGIAPDVVTYIWGNGDSSRDRDLLIVFIRINGKLRVQSIRD